MKEPKPLPCPGCNGTGQTTYFGGVSRFLLSYEDCPECNGVGFLRPEPDDNLLSEYISSQSSLSRPQAEKFLQILAQVLSESLLQGKTVQLRGFGSFSLSPTNAKKKRVRFTPGHHLQLVLNNSKR